MSEGINFILNSELVTVKVNPAAVLLDFIRQQKHLHGTKEGCKEGDCGACTVLVGSFNNGKVEYKSINSCLLPIANINNKHVVTIEGINTDTFTPIQKEFINEGASQCGFCTPGFIVSFTGYLINCKKFSYDDAVNSIAGNICRCTGYTSIKNVLKKIEKETLGFKNGKTDRITLLIKNNFLPEYFSNIPQRLKNIKVTKSNGAPVNIGKIISGGTDLYVQQPDELIETQSTFMSGKDLSFIKISDDICTVGSTATFEMIKESEFFQDNFPRMNKFMDLIASLPIRNSATIGGNIVNASPIGDLTIFVLALNSGVKITDGKNTRKVLLKDFYKGYKNLYLNSDEYVESIEFKIPENNSHFNFEKVSKRTYLDIASVNTAIYLETEKDIITNAHISAGGVAPVPFYLSKTSQFLLNKKIEYEMIDNAIQVIQSEITPISDVRGSDEYKRLLLEQLFKAHFIELFPELIKMEAFA